MYIQGRTVRKWANLAKPFHGVVYLLAGHRFSRLKVPALLRCQKLASKQMHHASTTTFIVHRP